MELDVSSSCSQPLITMRHMNLVQTSVFRFLKIHFSFFLFTNWCTKEML